jgi:predicted nucleic acid-binding protein
MQVSKICHLARLKPRSTKPSKALTSNGKDRARHEYHGLSDIEIEDFVRSIQQVALVVEVDAAKSVWVTRDRDDDPVIETAVRAKANYLCSIDKDIGAKDVVDHCKAAGVEVVKDTVLIAILRNQSQE